MQDDFLVQNGRIAGVTTLPSGLQYEIIHTGNGPKPKLQDNVAVHYVGTLTNGTEFDNSRRRKQPITFPVAGVILGWTEALQLMPEGSTWKIYIPAPLAYGTRGIPGIIPPNSPLIFIIELLQINP